MGTRIVVDADQEVTLRFAKHVVTVAAGRYSDPIVVTVSGFLGKTVSINPLHPRGEIYGDMSKDDEYFTFDNSR
jgi:hypothetical protein